MAVWHETRIWGVPVSRAALHSRFLARTSLATATEVGFSSLFWVLGGLAGLVATFGADDAGIPAGHVLPLRLFALGAIALGLAMMVLHRRFRYWMYRAALPVGAVVIAAAMWLAESPVMVVSLGLLMLLNVMDAVMYWPWTYYLPVAVLSAVLALAAMLLTGVPVAAVAVGFVGGCGAVAAAAWLARYTAESHVDRDTGLLNSAGFDRRLKYQMDTGKSLILLLVNIDSAASVSSRSTPSDYDEHACAQILRERFGDRGLIAHYANDQFGVIVQDASPGRAEALAEEIIRALSSVAIASIGMTMSQPAESPADFVDRATLALIQARSLGGGRAILYGDELKSAHELENAIANDELYLVYQPLVRMSDRSLKSFEALVRWNHPASEELSPLYFVPQAELTGAIHVLGEWVLDQVCRTIKEHDSAITVAVNASLPELQESGYAERVITTLARHGLAPRHLIVEVTETLVDQDGDAVVKTLRTLRTHGVKIAIDDFGSGYSSLRWLDVFPADYLKIDQAFIAGIKSVDQEVPVLQGIVAIARTLGFETIAEGVENEVQLAVMERLGIDLVQGFHFARPGTIDAGISTIQVVGRSQRD